MLFFNYLFQLFILLYVLCYFYLFIISLITQIFLFFLNFGYLFVFILHIYKFIYYIFLNHILYTHKWFGLFSFFSFHLYFYTKKYIFFLQKNKSCFFFFLEYYRQYFVWFNEKKDIDRRVFLLQFFVRYNLYAV